MGIKMISDLIQNYDKYRDLTPKLVILAIIWGISEIANNFAGLSETKVIYILVISAIIVGIWIFMEYMGKADDAVWAEANEAIKGIDKATQTKIYEGIQDIKFIDEFIDDEAEMIRRSKINSVALAALTPSIYHNQHCRRIKELGGRESYLMSKRTAVTRAFNKNHQRAKYMKMISKRLAKGTFDDLVKAYIYNLFVQVVGPALYESCEIKLRFYKEILARRDISRLFRKTTEAKVAKNEEYLTMIHDMLHHSSIVENAALHSQLAENIGCISQNDTPAPRRIRQPDVALKNTAHEELESSIIQTIKKNGFSEPPPRQGRGKAGKKQVKKQ